MEVIQTDEFQRAFRKLPKEIRRLYARQEERFRADWRDPRLHVKKVKELPYALSFRITRRYRVFFYFQHPESAIYFNVGHRKDAYR